MIAIKGSLQSRNYTDKNGNKRTAFDVVVDSVSFCGSKTQKEETEILNFENVNDDDFEEISLDDGDLPF